jgi:hypothetical protein
MQARASVTLILLTNSVREMCMDLISLETEEENKMVEAIMTKDSNHMCIRFLSTDFYAYRSEHLGEFFVFI